MVDLYAALMKIRDLQAGDLIISRTGAIASVVSTHPLVEAKKYDGAILVTVSGVQKRVSLIDLKEQIMSDKVSICSFSAMRVASLAKGGKSYNSATKKKLSSLISAMVRKRSD